LPAFADIIIIYCHYAIIDAIIAAIDDMLSPLMPLLPLLLIIDIISFITY